PALSWIDGDHAVRQLDGARNGAVLGRDPLRREEVVARNRVVAHRESRPAQADVGVRVLWILAQNVAVDVAGFGRRPGNNEKIGDSFSHQSVFGGLVLNRQELGEKLLFRTRLCQQVDELKAGNGATAR